MRCHRTAIVRVSSIKEVVSLENGKYGLLLKTGAEVPLSQRYKEDLLARLEQAST